MVFSVMKKMHSGFHESEIAMKTVCICFSLVAIGLFSGCSSSDPDRAVAASSDMEARNVPAPMTFEGPGKKLPPKIDAWEITSAPRYFGPDNLYDLINGGAEIYVQFGLKKMVTSEYRSPSIENTAVTVEIYDMGSPKGAFGRTARFLDGLLDPSGVGEGLPSPLSGKSILGDGDLVTWKDRYMIHLTLMDESPSASGESIALAGRKILPVFAAAVCARIENDPPLPSIFALFPAEKRLARSEAWQPERLIGVDGFGPGYTVRYVDGKLAWIAFATEELPDEAASKLAWESVKGADVEGRALVLKVAGKHVVGIVQDGNEPLGDKLIENLAATLLASFTEK
jgi:uncharacterized protein DUF6599